MKASTRRSTGTQKSSRTGTERIYAQYVRDLRTLLKQSAAREEKLAGMVQAVIDERFFRPVVTGEPRSQHLTPAIDPENMSDVATFDHEDDAKLIAEGQERAEQLEGEFRNLWSEQFGEEAPSDREQEVLHEM